MRKFIIENGLTSGLCDIPGSRKKIDDQANERGTNNLMSTMEQSYMGIVNNPPFPLQINTSHREDPPIILD